MARKTTAKHKFLVPIDNSDTAKRALGYAIKLAKESGAALHIVSAHEPPIVYGEVALHVSPEEAERTLEKYTQVILKAAAARAKRAGVKYATESLSGDIPHELVKAAKENGCDAIVMGTRGMGAIANLMMGSVATKVIHLSELPVTLVK
jgi:nucleotide-binding universal stress UspA family protein